MAKYQVKVESMLESIMPVFLKSITEDLLKLRAAVDAQDFATLQALGHKIKGSAGGYGFDVLGAIARDLEFSAKEKNIEAAHGHFNSITEFLSDYEIIYQDEE